VLNDRGDPTLPLFPGQALAGSPGSLEDRLRLDGYARIAGVDEAGRGPLAGPVVAAAVILDQHASYPGIDDSKKLDQAEREKAYWLILDRAEAVGLGLVFPEEIDRTDILTASLKAMAQAVAELDPGPDVVLVDGPHKILLNITQKAIVQGDRLVLSIAAASIVAKVFRDRLMAAYDRCFPAYGFAAHKGYATRTHLDALARHGPCRLHRRTFRGVESGP
jgi:ribonuclease HII